jgi:flagellar protein FliS
MNTATQGMKVTMLFDDAAKHIKAAISAINSKRVQEAHASIMKAQNIYTAMNGFLDKNYAISENLSKLYMYLAGRLAEANARKDIEILKDVFEYTVEFREIWKQAEINANDEAVNKTNANINRDERMTHNASVAKNNANANAVSVANAPNTTVRK